MEMVRGRVEWYEVVIPSVSEESQSSR